MHPPPRGRKPQGKVWDLECGVWVTAEAASALALPVVEGAERGHRNLRVPARLLCTVHPDNLVGNFTARGEQRERMLAQQREATASLREQETEEETQERLSQVREGMASLRASETPEQTQQRQVVDREARSIRREQETPEHAADRAL